MKSWCILTAWLLCACQDGHIESTKITIRNASTQEVIREFVVQGAALKPSSLRPRHIEGEDGSLYSIGRDEIYDFVFIKRARVEPQDNHLRSDREWWEELVIVVAMVAAGAFIIHVDLRKNKAKSDSKPA